MAIPASAGPDALRYAGCSVARCLSQLASRHTRAAYFNCDHVGATRKGTFLPDQPNQVAMMAQMQNIIDFPHAPKLAPYAPGGEPSGDRMKK